MKRTLLLLCLALMAFTLNAQNMKTLTWGGQERQYLEYVPTTYSAETPAPVLFMLHGLGDDATNFFNATDVRTVAEQRGWIVALNANTLSQESPCSARRAIRRLSSASGGGSK